MTLSALRTSYLVTGEGVRSPTWDRAWRAHLVGSLEVLVRELWQVGIDQIFVDGSFVEDKDHPNDIGIQDRFGNDLEFPSAFRVSRRDDLPKGIVRISR